jgi:hypothetical protein
VSAIHLKFASVERTEFGCVTRFDDGSFVNSTFHPQDPHYHVIAHRTGYEDDLHAYCLEHELVHCLLSERLHSRASPVLWALAHATEISGAEAAFEELSVQAFQRYLRAAEQPIVGGIDWLALKREAEVLLRRAG